MSEDPDRRSSDATAGADTDDATSEPEVIDGQGLVARLVGAGILKEDETVDDLRLTDEFRADWWERIETLRDAEHARRRVATVADIEPADVTLEEADDGRFVASHDGAELSEWPSRAAFLSDLALQPTMEEWLPLWERIDPISRGELLARIRAFLETCPVCGGALEIEEDANAGTGRGEVSIACLDCRQVMVSAEL